MDKDVELFFMYSLAIFTSLRTVCSVCLPIYKLDYLCFGGLIFGGFYIFWLLFCSSGVWTQGLALARQVLYLLSHTPSPFCSPCFSNRISHLCPGQSGPASSHWSFPCSLDDRHTTIPSFYCLSCGLTNFLLGLASNLNSPYLCIPNS
jgi:hypothetical protein